MDRPIQPALSQFVLKVHSRCDLACDHCYVYEHADTSWRGRPRAVSEEILVQVADRIAEHARRHRLPTVHVVLHGGEPLLAGPARLRRAAEELQRALRGVSALDLRMHTNGVLLDESFCDLFLELGIKVGVSLDGDKVSNDRHRRYADGRSSHHKVLRAVELLNRPRYHALFAGLLCTIDVENDPVAVYDALVELSPPRIDFLLPHATWDTPPPRPGGAATPYAAWLDAVYRRWDAAGRTVPVRIFDSVLRTLRGESSLTESLGLAPADLVVIETDGTFEQADSLKTSYDGAPATGMDVFTHSLDDVLQHPGMLARQQGVEQLCAQCRACPVVESCGGGLYAHRYRTGSTGSGFDNPSVFCPDLLALVTTIRDREAAVPAPTQAPAELPLPQADFGALAAGYGGADAVTRLAAAQLEINQELLAAVSGCIALSDREATAAWELLTHLDAEAPAELDAVLSHPYTRPWALSVLEGRAAPAGGLAEIAAATVVRAGLDLGVTVPVRDGGLRLPGLGAVRLADGAAEAEVRGGAEEFTVRAGTRRLDIGRHEGLDGSAPHWQPVRLFEGDGWSVAIEDTDPLRDCHSWPVARRIATDEIKLWAEDLTAAWSLIRRELPAYADGVAAGLRLITPLHAPDGSNVSAACKEAWGAIGAARPSSPDQLALLVVHEFQHVKLAAVLDAVDLYDKADRALYYAPWRPDPRPIGGLLQGTYAHIAVTDFWRVRRETAQDLGQRAAAAEQFARWRRQTADAVEELLASRSLSGLGETFVAGMGETVGAWLAEPVPVAAQSAAEQSARRHRAEWKARTEAVR
ncbi:FxsB family cyclophane-forming radical SAM/SPASM peptide maturase [Streptomyces sp. NBC_00083]|uniref:FxsB family cyclophane-forming radical SAM/SPASM peptide maturase n=1 Tax=Streptomyces sp. NBC_00083 TaxID=2975647 RepID=UPI00224ED5C3|nr:FxsB family cyclophane-forming radical SAM/SPASM peptide maturase [Streptomyces sp. NBC_00083]MCX5383740.1 FxsB family radical SAM/SPASM domain protein [Streptomyces sp. NBC_00083]